MFKVGEFIVYRRDVCEIKKINSKYHNGVDYIEVVPVSDVSLTLNIPVENKDIKSLMSKKEAEKLINQIPVIEIIEAENDKVMESEYKKLLKSGKHSDLIRIIKTTYLRNKIRLDQNKKIGDKDNSYFELAEKYLYTELAMVLKMSIEEAKEYVFEKVKKLESV